MSISKEEIDARIGSCVSGVEEGFEVLALPKNRVLEVTAKCNDMFAADLVIDGVLVKSYDGYVPEFMGGGDTLNFSIDLDTGRILNWKIPTESQVRQFVSDGGGGYR